MKTLTIIPSRLSATRLPGKPLLKINNLSIISHVFRKAQEANLGEVFVATEDQEIVDDVANNGGNAILTSRHHKTGTDRIYEALKKNEEIEIFSNGTISRNLILLDDVIKALVTISKNFNKVENFEIFNIASSNSMKTVEIASLIKHHLQSNSIINCVDKKYMFDWDVFVSNKKFTNYFNIELSSMEDAIFSYLKQKK